MTTVIPDIAEYLDDVVAVLRRPEAREPLRKAIEEWTGELGRGMTQGRSPDGTPFAPLKAETLARRENKRGAPLTNRGDLLLSLIGDGAGHVEEIGDDEASLGTLHNKNSSNPPIAVVHQLGSSKRNIPARPFIGVNDLMADAAADLIADHIERRLAAL